MKNTFKIAALGLCVSAAAQADNHGVKFSGQLWTEMNLSLTKNAKSLSIGVDRALLSANYGFDKEYSMDFGIISNNSATNQIVLENASITQKMKSGSLEVGFQHDSYISWLYQASGTRWVNDSLTSVGGYRSFRSLAANYVHNLSDGALAITLSNGNDNAFGSAPADMSVNGSVAYKTSLNENLNGQAYFSFQNKDEDSTATSSNNALIGAGAAIGGGSKDFNFLGEFALSKVQADGTEANMGYGATLRYAYQENSSFYGRFFSGNDGWKTFTGNKNSFELGILTKHGKHVDCGLLGEFANTTADTTTTAVKFRMAARF